LRLYALKYNSHSLLIYLDDKIYIKINKLGYPVAAAERGRRAHCKSSLKLKIVTLASFLVFYFIPNDFEGS